jgi:hypothetical protein
MPEQEKARRWTLWRYADDEEWNTTDPANRWWHHEPIESVEVAEVSALRAELAEELAQEFDRLAAEQALARQLAADPQHELSDDYFRGTEVGLKHAAKLCRESKGDHNA